MRRHDVEIRWLRISRDSWRPSEADVDVTQFQLRSRSVGASGPQSHHALLCRLWSRCDIKPHLSLRQVSRLPRPQAPLPPHDVDILCIGQHNFADGLALLCAVAGNGGAVGQKERQVLDHFHGVRDVACLVRGGVEEEGEALCEGCAGRCREGGCTTHNSVSLGSWCKQLEVMSTKILRGVLTV